MRVKRRRQRRYSGGTLEDALAEERILAKMRSHIARANARIVRACWIDESGRAVVTVERGYEEPRFYTVRQKSPTAQRLARLVGDRGRPLFTPQGVNIPKNKE